MTLAMTLALGQTPPAEVPAPRQARCRVSAPKLHWMSLLSWLALVRAHELWAQGLAPTLVRELAPHLALARGLVPRQARCREQGRARQE